MGSFDILRVPTHIHLFIIKHVNNICITVLSRVSDLTFNSVECIVITIYCAPINGNSIAFLPFAVYVA